MMINVAKLDADLRAAGIPIDGCAADGRIDYRPEAAAEQRTQGAAILAAHDPAPSLAQRIAAARPHASRRADLLQVRAILIQRGIVSTDPRVVEVDRQASEAAAAASAELG